MISLLILLSPLENPSASDLLNIAEADFKLALEFNNSNKREVDRILKNSARNLLNEYSFRPDLRYDVTVEEGSIIAKIKIYGLVFFNLVVGYGAFRDGLKGMVEDGITASEYLIQHSKHGIINRDSVLKAIPRAGYLERLYSILGRIDYLRAGLDKKNIKDTQEELNKLYHDLANLIQLLSPDEKKKLLNSLPNGLRRTLPHPDKDGVERFRELYSKKQ